MYCGLLVYIHNYNSWYSSVPILLAGRRRNDPRARRHRLSNTKSSNWSETGDFDWLGEESFQLILRQWSKYCYTLYLILKLAISYMEIYIKLFIVFAVARSVAYPSSCEPLDFLSGKPSSSLLSTGSSSNATPGPFSTDSLFHTTLTFQFRLTSHTTFNLTALLIRWNTNLAPENTPTPLILRGL